jgi:hypothetical protein
MPEFLDIMLVVTERDRIKIAFRCLAAHQRREAIFAEHLGDGAQPVGALGMSGRRGVFEAGPVAEKKRRHAIPWRVRTRFSRKH